MLLGFSIVVDLLVSSTVGTDTSAGHVPGTPDCTWVLHIVMLPPLKLQGFSSVLEITLSFVLEMKKTRLKEDRR